SAKSRKASATTYCTSATPIAASTMASVMWSIRLSRSADQGGPDQDADRARRRKPEQEAPHRLAREIAGERRRDEEAEDHEGEEDQAEPELVDREMAEDAEHHQREEAADEEDRPHRAAQLRRGDMLHYDRIGPGPGGGDGAHHAG